MILIYGKGKVGRSVAALCTYKKLAYEWCDDTDTISNYEPYEAIIPSPGIPSNHPIYATGKVLGELDFAASFLPKGFQSIAVTGTDGKSTTAWILYNIIKNSYSVNSFSVQKKKKTPTPTVYLSGNFDIPFSQSVLGILERKEIRGVFVIEVSSFMAYALSKFPQTSINSFVVRPFAPSYTIVTNIKPDHLNWHASLEEYVQAKLNLLRQTTKKIICNRQVRAFLGQESFSFDFSQPSIRLFGEAGPKERDWTDGERIVISGRTKFFLSQTSFSGRHNALNILSCGLVANEMRICSRQTKKILSEIPSLPHRLQCVGEKKHIIFIDDSKSTSAQSLEAALGAYKNPQHPKNLLLIVGGSDKGDNFEYLFPLLQERVKAMACIGETKKTFHFLAKKGNIPAFCSDVLNEAVPWLFGKGEPGDVLLLSPGCASFGLFRDYEDRAHQFLQALATL